MKTATLPPIARILAGSLVLQRMFLEVRQTATLLVQWTREHLTWQTRMSDQAREVDDPLETALVTFEEALPTLKAALANDTPAQRRRVMTAAHCILAAARETHLRTEVLSRELHPTIPPTLQTE